MAIIGGWNLEFKLKQIVLGQTCWTKFEYTAPNGGVTAPVSDIIETFVGDVVTPMTNFLSIQWTAIELQWRYFRPASSTLSGIYPVNGIVGLVAGDCAPSFVTYSYGKFPNNTEKEPVGAPDMSRGRFGISGVPESVIAGNHFTLGAVYDLAAAWATTAVAFTVNPGVDDDYFQLYLERPGLPGQAPLAVAPVDTIVLARIGTQNTRKL